MSNVQSDTVAAVSSKPDPSTGSTHGVPQKARDIEHLSGFLESQMKRHRVAAILSLITLASLVSAQVVPPRVRIPESVMAQRLARRVAPVYPPLARQAKVQGVVVLRVLISKSGEVENVELVSGHPMLAPAAIEAVKQWKYTPYLLNGEPIEVVTQVTVNFSLSDRPESEGVVGDKPGGIPSGETGGVRSSEPAGPLIPLHQRVRVSSGVMQSFVVSKVPPQYPQDARDQRIQGTVVLKAAIGKEGVVENLVLISGHPLLAPAAIEAVKQWKYQPYLLNGAPVEVETQISVNFTLVN